MAAWMGWQGYPIAIRLLFVALKIAGMMSKYSLILHKFFITNI